MFLREGFGIADDGTIDMDEIRETMEELTNQFRSQRDYADAQRMKLENRHGSTSAPGWFSPNYGQERGPSAQESLADAQQNIQQMTQVLTALRQQFTENEQALNSLDGALSELSETKLLIEEIEDQLFRLQCQKNRTAWGKSVSPNDFVFDI